LIRYLFLTGCLFVCLIAYGQAPVANFSASVTSGCAPLQVTFSDLSTGDPKFWNWDLGNGQLSGAKNPVAVYNTPGVYTVRLVVRNADGTDGMTKTDYITVNPSPYADFTSNLNLTCAPSLIQFTDISVGNGGAITKWQWSFGDGTTSSERNPAKTYSTPGYYTVSLTVTSVTGCFQSMTKPRFIRVVAGVSADFIDSVPQVCRTPIDLKFLNETSGPGNISYNWNFGNGNTSTAEDPVVQFPAAGTYQVKLAASSSLGCSDSTEKTITISDTITRFTAPDSVCIDQPVSFSNNSSATPVSSSWDFGNGNVAGVLNPVQAFPAAGIYTVKLVNTYRNCTDSVTKNIAVLTPPTVDFTADRLVSCKAPFTVTFQDNSTDAAAWEWDFGDGIKSTQRNPVHTYTSAGIYTVSLTITSAFGCKNILTRNAYINITAPTVSITNVPAGGCIPFTFSPVASVNAVDGVAGYLWNFGNGNSSTSANPTSTYPAVGIYDLQLTITTNGGCTATANIPGGVRTGTPPVVDFSFSKAVTCASEQIQFTDLSNPANEWLWNFGDNRTSIEKNPVHVYDSAGIYTVTLTALNNGCAVTHTKPAVITVTPPVARFKFQADCVDRLAVSFTDLSVKDISQPLSFEWDFGDVNIPKSALPNPSVRYSAMGTYNVTLKVSNGSCVNTTSSVVTLTGDKADFAAPDVTVCRDVPFTINAINSNPQNITSYEWTLQGIPPFAGPRQIGPALHANGTYDVTLKITE
jgi:PKD repeat protein